MYTAVHNSAINFKVSPKDLPDFNIKFGQFNFPVCKKCVILSSPILRQQINAQPTIRSVDYEPCDFRTGKNIADYIQGNDLFVTPENYSFLQKIALEIGLSEIVENCYLLSQADIKIQNIISILKSTNHPDPNICVFVARFYFIFTLYGAFSSITPECMLDILKNSSVLGITDETNFLNFLIRYESQCSLNKYSLDLIPQIYEYVDFKAINSPDFFTHIKSNNRNIVTAMQKKNTSFHLRVLIEKPGSNGFPRLLSTIINTPIDS